MRSVYSIILLVLISSCTYDNLSQKDLESIRGNWTGTGQFNDAVVNEEFGKINFNIIIHEDGRVGGNFGDGRFFEAQAGKKDSRIDISVVLDERINKEMYCRKDHVVFLMTEINEKMIKGDFHLKNNFVFDLSMRAGKFVLNRINK